MRWVTIGDARTHPRCEDRWEAPELPPRPPLTRWRRALAFLAYWLFRAANRSWVRLPILRRPLFRLELAMMPRASPGAGLRVGG